ncbi:MAG: Formimidoylglutamase [Acidobacteria bacterium]|jgi:formiminoglutamase|nr:Formimidoylglutamase [Acidobacteriota bacterium]
MNELFQTATRPDESLFTRRNDPNDVRLGEIISTRESDYDSADIVIIGCPQDEGVTRNGGRDGARFAPDAIRREFYRLTPFGIKAKIFDFGNTIIQGTLEETHEAHCRIVTQFLRDGKRIIVLGGGNDISYPDGCAMSDAFGNANWIAINIDAHFDVRADRERNSGTPYRQLLEERLLTPDYFYEIGFQPQLASPVYYRYLQNLGVNLISLDQLRSRETADLEIRESIRQKFVSHSSSLSTFFGFDIDAVRSSEAPGSSAPNPFGLRAGEFLTLVQFAAKLTNTKIIEFSEVNPNFDIDNRTSKLVAVAMHKFCVG